MSDVTDLRVEAAARAVKDAMLRQGKSPDAHDLAQAAIKAADAVAWRPIESAPKDGACILVPVKHIGADVVSWHMNGWRETSNGLLMRDRPTHWMPLPPPPVMGGCDE